MRRVVFGLVLLIGFAAAFSSGCGGGPDRAEVNKQEIQAVTPDQGKDIREYFKQK